MRSDSRANPWSSYDDDVPCWWEAEFPMALGPGVLPLLQLAVLSAGETTDVYRVGEIDRIGYSRVRDGGISNFLAAHPPVPGDDEWLPDRFALRCLETLPLEWASTLLTYRAPDGQLAEARVHDMETFAAPLGLAPTFYESPVSIGYTIFEADTPAAGVVGTNVSLSTDIWFPWTSGWSHREYSSGRETLDNRTLGRINGERLNAFLGRVRDAAIRLGGTWIFHPVMGRFAVQANEYGVILDAPRPADPA